MRFVLPSRGELWAFLYAHVGAVSQSNNKNSIIQKFTFVILICCPLLLFFLFNIMKLHQIIIITTTATTPPTTKKNNHFDIHR